jgi:hypothetical protein
MRVGNHQRIVASNVMVVGNHNTITGNNNQVTGHHNKVNGNNNQIVGNHNTTQGDDNMCTGRHNKTEGIANSDNVVDDNVIVVVNDDDNVVRVNNFGGFSETSWFGNIRKPKPKKKKQKEPEDEPIFIECPLASDPDTLVPDDAPDGTPMCVVCTANAPSCIILPCMHKSL